MPLINCPECGNQISDTAKSCPHCGYNFKSSNLISTNITKYLSARMIIGLCVAIISFIIVFIGIGWMTSFSKSAIRFNNDFTTGIIIFLIGLFVLYISCLLIKYKVPNYNKIFLIGSGVCILALVITFLSLGWDTETEEEYYARMALEIDNEKKSKLSTTWSYSDNKAFLTSNEEENYNKYDKGYMLMTLEHNSNMQNIEGLEFDVSDLIYFGIVDKNGKPLNADFEKINSLLIDRETNTPSNATILAVFNDGYENHYSALCGSDNSAISIINSKEVADFIYHIKNSSRCDIVVNFDNYHAQTFNFDCSNLKWNY